MGSFKSKHSHNSSSSQHEQPVIHSSSYNLDQNKVHSNDISSSWDSHEEADLQSSVPELRENSPLHMPIQPTFKCAQCGMVFSTDEALFQHRTRICLGPKDHNTERKPYYSDSNVIHDYTRENFLKNQPSFREVLNHQSPLEKVIMNLYFRYDIKLT